MELTKEVQHAGPGQPLKEICIACLEGKSVEDPVPDRLVWLSLRYSRTKYK